MKKLFTLCSLLFLVFSSTNAQLLSENFNFTGALTSNGWTAHSAGGTNTINTSASGLSYTGYANSGIGNAADLVASGEDINKSLSSSVTTGSVYLSFLIQVKTVTTTTGNYVIGLYESATVFPLRIFVKSDGASGCNFGVSRGSSAATYAATSYSLNTTYLITAKYTYDASATLNDIVSIYIHPVGGATLTEPSSYSATNAGAGTGADASAAGMGAVYLRQGTAADAITVTIDGIRVATDWGTAIPVELVSFKAQKQNQTTKLEWQTATELNNNYYDIERSMDGKAFEKIGDISGYGNSSLMRTYSFVDEKPNNGINYYRLRQVDFDGTATLSKTVSVDFSKNLDVKVYPNIVKEQLTFEINGDGSAADLSIVNMLGQVVKQQNLKSTEGVISLNVNNLANGQYILKVTTKSGQMSQRFEKQ
ncbi:MAG: T9SS type A sorting domain-containing protein [Saprospiraceae bacterium]|nr:T9SS type A sorting domain-containing protein [Saprospiraceae bacterium]